MADLVDQEQLDRALRTPAFRQQLEDLLLKLQALLASAPQHDAEAPRGRGAAIVRRLRGRR